MSRKTLLLNVVLVGLLIWVGVRVSGYWQEANTRKTEVMSRKPQPQDVKAPPAASAVEAPQATQYIEVATKMLFSKDRNPVEILPPPPPPPPAPPPPPPEAPPPALPAYYGRMTFGDDPVLVLAVDGKQKSFRKGEKVGEYELAEFDDESLTLSWHEKTYRKTFKELTVVQAVARPAQVAAAPAANNAASSGTTRIGAGPATANAEKPKSTGPQFGEKQGNLYMCVSGDNSTDGTVHEGYRLRRMDNLFGATCQWEPMK